MNNTYIYDDAIVESLMRVGREAEYLPGDDIGDDNRIKRYRKLYTSALEFVAGELRDNLLIKSYLVVQMGDLPDGWGYLPLDFIMFESRGAAYEVSLAESNGRKIIKAVGQNIKYIAMPEYVHSLYYNLKEAIMYKFLSNCVLIDTNFSQYAPMITDLQIRSLSRANIEARNLKQNLKTSGIDAVNSTLSSASNKVKKLTAKFNIFGS